MGELPFDPVSVVAEFIEQCGREGTKSMGAHFILGIAHAAYCIEYGRIGQRACYGADGGEEKLSVAGKLLQLFQDFYSLF